MVAQWVQQKPRGPRVPSKPGERERGTEDFLVEAVYPGTSEEKATRKRGRGGERPRKEEENLEEPSRTYWHKVPNARNRPVGRGSKKDYRQGRK